MKKFDKDIEHTQNTDTLLIILQIKKVEQISKINKEQMLLKQHCQVWWREYKRLSENR